MRYSHPNQDRKATDVECSMKRWRRNLRVPKGRSIEVTAMLKAIHAQENRGAVLKEAGDVIEKLKGMKLFKAARCVEEVTKYEFLYQPL